MLQGDYTSDKVGDFVTKYSTLATFFCDFLSCCVACSWVAIRAIFTVRWDATSFSKIASPVQANNSTCSRGFSVIGENMSRSHISVLVMNEPIFRFRVSGFLIRNKPPPPPLSPKNVTLTLVTANAQFQAFYCHNVPF